MFPGAPSAAREVLTKLYDLKLFEGDSIADCWKESARWVKYEENVEGVEPRWGQPHVAILSLPALLQLRDLLRTATLLLDVDVEDFDDICTLIAAAVVSSTHNAKEANALVRTLKLKRNHLSERRARKNSLFNAFMDVGQVTQFRLMRDRSRSVPDASLLEVTKNGAATQKSENMSTTHAIKLGDNTSSKMSYKRRGTVISRKLGFGQADLTDFRGDVILKSLPEGTEAAQVFVGVNNALSTPRFVMVRLQEATYLPESMDRMLPVRFVFAIIGPQLFDGSYHELGRSVGTLMTQQHFSSVVHGDCSVKNLVNSVDHFLGGSVVVPPGDVDSQRLLTNSEITKALRKRRASQMKGQKVQDVHLGSLPTAKKVDADASVKRTSARRKGKLFGGMVDDIRRRLPYYKSDFTDALNFQCFTSIVFMFFACFAPTITFGGLMGGYTNERMGMIEMLFAQCICGVIWGIFSAQPLLIMSATGPVLIFEASMFAFCKALGLDFLSIRLYAGFWILVISVLVVAFDGSRLLVYVTRFTEDIFAMLISAIFIAESLHFVYHTFQQHPVGNYKFYYDMRSNCIMNLSATLPPLPPSAFTPPSVLSESSLPPSAATSLSEIAAIPEVPQVIAEALTTASPLIESAAIGFPETSEENDDNNDVDKAAGDAPRGPRRVVRDAELHSALQNFSAVTMPPELERYCGKQEPNTALLTALVLMTTFCLAILLDKLRDSFYLGKHARRVLGDFGVLIAIVLVAVAVRMCIPGPYIQRLDMPDHINLTNPQRRKHGLLVIPRVGSDNWYGVFVALAAAILVFILLFVETEITELLLSRKEKGCKKGSGMNWDLVLVGICAFICSLFGLPWMCVGAVQSLAHCSSLSVMRKKAPGAKPVVDHVIEQRVTTIVVSLLIGLVAFAGSYLRLPLACLFGVFLYLGIRNLSGLQLARRIILFLIPEKYFPNTPYTQEVCTWRLHLYTSIQVVFVLLIYLVKHFKQTALAFPFVLIVFVVFRHVALPWIFSQTELKALEDEEEDDAESGTPQPLAVIDTSAHINV
ncbi:anion exchange protein 3-like isoform X10 [Aphelenchoides avenae]|nr:anion exchange protein 3-like isoform X10 [Aphelenchus avenae]